MQIDTDIYHPNKVTNNKIIYTYTKQIYQTLSMVIKFKTYPGQLGENSAYWSVGTLDL